MPFRVYLCHECDNQLEIYQGIKEDILCKCEKCGGKLYQDLSGIIGSVVGEPKTLGQLADQNAKKLGYSKVQQLESDKKEAANQEQRKKYSELSEKLGRKLTAPCDRKRPTIDGKEIKKMDKDVQKKIFSGDKKEIEKKATKYINEGRV